MNIHSYQLGIFHPLDALKSLMFICQKQAGSDIKI